MTYNAVGGKGFLPLLDRLSRAVDWINFFFPTNGQMVFYPLNAR
jgi:hypothetical protein